MRYLCRECDDTEDIIQPPQKTETWCSICGKYTVCYLNYEPCDKRPQQRTRKKSNKYEYIRITKKQKKALEKKAKKIGCSVHSLVVNYIDNGLNPPLVQTQSGYIPAPVQRPPAVGLPPSRKKGEKDPLVDEIEKHPMFVKMKKRYG